MFCPKCGTNASELKNCPNCGLDIYSIATKENSKINSTSIPQYPMSYSPTELAQPKKVNRFILVIIYILAVAFISIIITIFDNVKMANVKQSPNSEYFHNTKWGMSFDEVIEQLGDSGYSADSDKTSILTEVQNYENLKGVNASIDYQFENDALTDVVINLTSLTNNSKLYRESKLVEEFVKKYDRFYGKHKEEVDSPSLKVHKATHYKWNTRKSKITLASIEEGKMILIFFSDNSKPV